MSMEITELLEGARNCVEGFCGMRRGEEALILTDNSGYADPMVVDALALTCRNLGVKVSHLIISKPASRQERISKIVSAAICEANVVFNIQEQSLLHSRAGGKAMYEYETMFCNVATATRELMASAWARFPMDLTWTIAKRVFEVARNSKTFHVTDGAGTDMQGGIYPTHITGFPVNIEPGPGLRSNNGYWPGATCGLHPEGDVYGVIVASYDHRSNLPAPMKLTVENHRIVKIEGGGIIGESWEDDFKNFKNANWVTECMWGFHPKVRKWKSPGIMAPLASRGSGTLHFGVGNGRALGGNVVTNYHNDVVLLKPTLWLDSFKMIDNGRLKILDEPNIREIASKYGNPDVVLGELD